MALNKEELQTIAELLNIGVFNLAGKNAQAVSFIQNRLAEEYQQLEAAPETVQAKEEVPNAGQPTDSRDSSKPK